MTPGREKAIRDRRSAIAQRLGDVARRRGEGSQRPSRRLAHAPAISARGARRIGGGFTLIEILIVVSIIGILITLAQPSFNRAVTAAKEATLKENLFVFRDVIDQFYADNAKYPESLNALVEKGYIRKIPKDPITDSAETWVLVPANDEQGQPVGIYDVKSGSDRTAHDGTRFSDW